MSSSCFFSSFSQLNSSTPRPTSGHPFVQTFTHLPLTTTSSHHAQPTVYLSQWSSHFFSLASRSSTVPPLNKTSRSVSSVFVEQLSISNTS
jgi:hypothetical protein